MKETNTCPKCRSRKIVIVKGKSSTTHKVNYGNWGRSEKLNRYICTRCGYLETYIAKSDKFLKWAKKNIKEVPEEDEGFV